MTTTQTQPDLQATIISEGRDMLVKCFRLFFRDTGWITYEITSDGLHMRDTQGLQFQVGNHGSFSRNLSVAARIVCDWLEGLSRDERMGLNSSRPMWGSHRTRLSGWQLTVEPNGHLHITPGWVK